VTVANFRDTGGHPTAGGGRVRTGLLYRSTELSGLNRADSDAIRRLGIRTVYDLRTDEERIRQPEQDRLPAGIAYVVADVLGNSEGPNPASFARLLADPRAATEALRDERGAAMFESRYRDFVHLPSALAAYRRLFAGLVVDARLPAVVHCTTGKDRTGWAIAVLLMLLNVPGPVILADFLASNAALGALSQPMIDGFAAAGGDPALLVPLVGVRPSYLAAALDEVATTFGSMDRYLTDGLGLDEALQARLRARFVAPA
jgi:protein-tyrosine phosphatase